ncbi:putative clathrin assembly protein At4g02650 [Phragmites australis]|uniref:putative clathrin assembly protein At4g02650 n=1 Tax=Phragmites australis TaxID=29695 RepID=UPI002D78E85F|nr:putative clathrin assembly protein At4g02650 [Phragmites australis]
MAPSKLRQALGAAKDQTSIALARAGGADEASADLVVAIVRATVHGEGVPTDERHVQEIITLTRYSRARVAACVASVSRRLGRTRAWHVALKALALVHRLLADGDPAYEQEVFLATRRGRRMLDMSRFGDHDCARSRAWDFSAFVRAYAGYLDDRLKHRMQGRGVGVASPSKWRLDGGRDSFHDTDVTYEVDEAWALVPRDRPATETATEDLIASAQQLRHLLDRFIACRPRGKARTNRVVCAALYMLVKESVVMYCELTEVMAVLIDRFAELETPGCVRVHSIFTSLAKLVDELDDFYSWCKATAVCRPSDVPALERVKQKKLDLMDEFIRGRQALASQKSHSPAVPLSPQSPGVKKYGNKAGKVAPAESAGSLVAVDDKMADFLNLDEDTSPPSASGKEHGQKLALALFDGNSAEASPKWVVFEDSSADWETSPVQSSSSSAATRPPGATALALPPPPGASSAAAAWADPFAASLAMPAPTYVQMTDLQTRQRLLVEEQMAWQQYERQRAAWSYINLL